jgi:hypothetical protein
VRNGATKTRQPSDVDEGAAAHRRVAVEDVDADMGVPEQRKAGDSHEHRAVQPDVEVLQRDRAGAEAVAHDDDGKADEHDGERAEGQHPADQAVEARDRAHDERQCRHLSSPGSGPL